MERQLSSAQRDQLLINEAKEDSKFKRDMAEAMRQSNETFETSMQQMSTSIVQVRAGATGGVGGGYLPPQNFDKCPFWRKQIAITSALFEKDTTVVRNLFN